VNILFFIGKDAVAINHSAVYQNLLWLVSSVNILFFIGTDAACPPVGWSPLIILLYIKICYGSFHLWTFYFLLVQMRFAIDHAAVYQNLLCSFHLYYFAQCT